MLLYNLASSRSMNLPNQWNNFCLGHGHKTFYLLLFVVIVISDFQDFILASNINNIALFTREKSYEKGPHFDLGHWDKSTDFSFWGKQKGPLGQMTQ